MTNGYGQPSLNRKIEQKGWNERGHRYEGWRGKKKFASLRRRDKRHARAEFWRMIQND